MWPLPASDLPHRHSIIYVEKPLRENPVLTDVVGQMEAFKQCWKRQGNEQRTDSKNA